MTAIVFSGPTLSQNDISEVGEFTVYPPAMQGDVYKALKKNPSCIGIIDGYFDGAAAVWHKEILWAMSQGIPVFGAASMGALRAAELADFGMTGVGKIFDDYRNGTLEDDDEVAIIHGPSDLGYPALSEPMVNIRATIAHAQQAKVICETVAQSISRLAKSQPFHKRTWKTLETPIATLSRGAAEARKIINWMLENHVNQKRQDAMAMLAAMVAAQKSGFPQNRPSFVFERTSQWEQAVALWDRQQAKGLMTPQSTLDELRLRPDEFRVACDAVKIKLLARHGPTRNAAVDETTALARKINGFRLQNGLLSRGQLDHWMEQNQLTAQELETLLAEELQSKDSFDHGGEVFMHELLNFLKLTGRYQCYAQRAQQKRECLKEYGPDGPRLSHTGMPGAGLLEWYFRQRLGTNIPLDIDAYLIEFGLVDRPAFYRMLASEFLFRQGEKTG